ncbi:hypothetical protein VTL71DRAFT_9658 [Oculimacula yallundae]|uniref:Uncharacterized protein n=1 Tax=Oculimacula yallundae TaxID=86028 RepID=A0ABR4BUB8_9HELO
MTAPPTSRGRKPEICDAQLQTGPGLSMSIVFRPPNILIYIHFLSARYKNLQHRTSFSLSADSTSYTVKQNHNFKMQCLFFIIAALLSLFTPGLGNAIIFINKDSVGRAIEGTENWKPPLYYPPVPGTWVPGNGRATVRLSEGSAYMFKSIYNGGNCADPHNVEGEVKFNGHNDHTWFDLSVVELNKRNLPVRNSYFHWLHPANDATPRSGCSTFPCDNVYKFPTDDKNHALDINQHELTAISYGSACDYS